MKALVLSANFPSQPERDVTGTFKRFDLFLEAFSRIADELEIFFFVPPAVVIDEALHERYAALYETRLKRRPSLTFIHLTPERPRPDTVERYLRRPFDLYHPGEFRFYRTSGPEQVAAIEASLGRPRDAVFVHRLSVMAPILRSSIKTPPPIFFDLDDVEHFAHLRNVFSPPRWGSKFLGLPHTVPLFLAEQRAVALSRRVYLCSEPDRRYFNRVHRTSRGEVIPNSVEIPPPTPVPPDLTLLLLGTYDYAPNAAAATWLIERVWPLVSAAVPEAKLVIAGRHFELMDCARTAPPTVLFPGFVPDLEQLYRGTRIVCCPILSGGGTRFKIIEAAAFGRPVVATPVGAEGLVFRDGTDILLRGDPRSFAEACIRLLRDSAMASRIGAAARATAIAHYDRAPVVDRIVASVRAGLAEAR